MFKRLGAFRRILYFRVQTGTKPNLSYRGFSFLCLRGLVLLAASCTSLYKQAPKQNLFNGCLVVYVYGLGAFRRILYFRVQTGTKPILFNGGWVIYVYGLGAFSRILYFRVQTGTKPNLSYRGFSC